MKRIQRVLFNKIPDSDGDDNFTKKRDYYGGNMTEPKLQ